MTCSEIKMLRAVFESTHVPHVAHVSRRFGPHFGHPYVDASIGESGKFEINRIGPYRVPRLIETGLSSTRQVSANKLNPRSRTREGVPTNCSLAHGPAGRCDLWRNGAEPADTCLSETG